MKSVVCPELSTAAAGSSQAPTAAVDNSAPSLNRKINQAVRWYATRS